MNQILKHAVTTLLRMILLLAGVSIISFLLVISSPIDPIDAYVGAESNVSQEQRENVAEYWGLNEPPVKRYFTWLSKLMQGDMGTSITYQKPVTQILGSRFLASVTLMAIAWLLSGLFGFLLGIMSGAMQGSLFDKCVKTFCFVISSTPTFWIALLMLMLFSIRLGWFPIGLSVPIGKLSSEVTLLERVHHLILPALTLSITGISSIALHTRQKIIDVLKSDYILFAKARGENKWTLIRRHGLRNIAIPAITLQFASFSELFGGSVLAENVFSYPGLGSAASAAGLKGDVPLLLGIALCSVLFVFVGNLSANLLYGILNPQIREGGTLL
ncbi:ABC transporter permease [Anaerocolumna cellulosilytica]|uniref:ABC transporter permease n=1 Tax=Anaerocolumna cellulosilytica TaxID=433286 RepID=A0A6S6R195_9FIRM|nr:ABC transporter permease [Anaerocolumna cellulosilytica]MBB5195594.1 peptide/nickel transport system permease protein [Anaerocolumna cellulosilytica]BCJ93837.1 ABC transporter permease [Anaerocolumna cellulosilytica]